MKWWKEIQSGIVSADIFVCILSPAYLTSPICILEADYALQNGKRVIPLLYQKFDLSVAFGKIAAYPINDELHGLLAGRDLLMLARETWTTVVSGNWIDFRLATSFDTSFKLLIESVEHDATYIKAHTRLQEQALAWEQDPKAKTPLSGEELQRALDWLKKSRLKRPPPTPSQERFIQAGISARQRRRWVWGVTTATVVTLSLLLIVSSLVALKLQEQNTLITELRDALSVIQTFTRGNANYNQGNYEQALPDLATAVSELQDHPDYITIYDPPIPLGEWLNELGLAYAQVKQWANAETNLHAAITANPQYPFSYLNLAIVYRETGRFDEAEASLQQVLILAEDDAFAQYLVQRARGINAAAQGDWETAEQILTPLLAIPVNDTSLMSIYREILYYTAISYQNLDQPDVACTYWRQYMLNATEYPITARLLHEADRGRTAAERIKQLQCIAQ